MKFVPAFTSLIVIVFLLAFIVLPKSSFSEIENRSLASFPKLNWDDIKDGDYMSDVSAYLSDHFPLKNTFVNSKTQFEQHVLKMDCINNIYIGKDGYRIEQYEKPENTGKIINTINKFNEAVENINVDLMLVPTAYTIYDDKLPYYHRDISQLETLNNIYSSVSTSNIDVYPSFMLHRDNEQLFYKLDHHWTTDGAYYAYVKYCEHKGFTPVPKEDFNIQEVTNDFKGTIYSKLNDYSLEGDVIKVYGYNNDLTVNYDNKKTTNSLYNMDYVNKKDKYSLFLDNLHSYIEITNNNIDTDRELVIAKDSYANSFIPFLVNHYKKIYVFDPRSYKGSISDFVNEHNNVKDVLMLYNMNTIDQDTGINAIY